jgi:hypothetical protein
LIPQKTLQICRVSCDTGDCLSSRYPIYTAFNNDT